MEKKVSASKCPKCGGEFEEGVIVDKNYVVEQQQTWAAKIRLAGWAGKENEVKVKTYRCKNCGYLESYAK